MQLFALAKNILKSRVIFNLSSALSIPYNISFEGKKYSSFLSIQYSSLFSI